MTGKVYCYHCMTYHHPEAMRKVVTRAGERWRCIRSIEAAQTGAAERKAQELSEKAPYDVLVVGGGPAGAAAAIGSILGAGGTGSGTQQPQIEYRSSMGINALGRIHHARFSLNAQLLQV